MRVLHVITGLGAGGAEQWLRLMLRYSSVDTDVVTLTNPGALADALRADGVPVTNLGMRGNRDLAVLPRLRRHISQGRYDVVHTHLFRAQLYGAIAARAAGVRTVVSTEHSLNDRLIEGRPTDRPGVRSLYMLQARLNTVTLAVSEPVANRLARWGVPPSRIETVPVGLDASMFAFNERARLKVRAELGLQANAPLVGGVGRLVSAKRFEVLLETVARIPNTTALLVGDGPSRPELEALAAKLGISDRVRFVGETIDVAPWLSAMDVFASPSPEETFGIAVLEALAAGLPVVYSRCPAVEGLSEAAVGPAFLADSAVDPFEHALRKALDRTADDRRPPPAVALYDGLSAARKIDDVYRRCTASSRRTGQPDPTTMGSRRG